jgi:drug/metabolite transporter (DMT)-like permease
MAISVSLASLNTLVLRHFKNRTFTTPGDSFFFNGGLSLMWTLIMLLWFFISGDRTVSGTAMIYGTVFGCILCGFLFLKNESLASGPVSLTALIGNCAFIIATLFGVFYAQNPINVFQIIGMALIALALLLCINPKKSGEKLSAKWFVCCFFFFLVGGFVGIFNIVFGRSPVKNEINGMMLTASVVSCVLFFLMGIAVNKAKKQPLPTIRKGALIYILISGISGCTYFRLNTALTPMIPSPIFFPVSNGGIVIISTFVGALLFKEKLNKIQFWGIIIGLIAIVVTGCGQAIWDLVF